MRVAAKSGHHAVVKLLEQATSSLQPPPSLPIHNGMVLILNKQNVVLNRNSYSF